MAISTDQAAPLDADPAPLEGVEQERPQCAVARCGEVVSGKWTLLVIRDLATGPKSYSDLESSLSGISPRTLCDRLKLLAGEGLISRTRIRGLPPRTVYELTEHGFALVPIIETMRSVGEALLVRTPNVAAAEAIAVDACCD